MNLAKVLFWLSFGLFAYHLIGYPLILFLANIIKPKKKQSKNELQHFPTVTVLCPAYNEEESIGAKIESFLKLDYPKNKVKMIVISDDSSDGTNEIVESFAGQNVELLIQKPRRGKPSALNLVLPMLDSDYVLSTDANSMFAPDALRLLMEKMLSDPRLGLVSGELRLIPGEGNRSGEGLYWRYESKLKHLESELGGIIVSNGSIFLIRTDLFEKVDPQSTDDFERVLTVLRKEWKTAYEPRANVFEEETQSAGQEMSRKIRIVTREWFVVERNLVLLNPFRHPAVCFKLFSHKLLRWLFFFFVLTGFIASIFLFDILFYRIIFCLQLAVYGYGALSLLLQKKNRRLPFSTAPAYLVAMIWSATAAFFRYITRVRTNTWEPVR